MKSAVKRLVIIPTFNEASNVVVLLPRLFKYIPDLSVLIVDDVVTTGATVLALAAAIELAGYQVAGICAIARRN